MCVVVIYIQRFVLRLKAGLGMFTHLKFNECETIENNNADPINMSHHQLVLKIAVLNHVESSKA